MASVKEPVWLEDKSRGSGCLAAINQLALECCFSQKLLFQSRPAARVVSSGECRFRDSGSLLSGLRASRFLRAEDHLVLP